MMSGHFKIGWVVGTLCVGLLSADDLKLVVPGIKDAVLISLPENHDSAKKWPAVFSYHGFNGRPETRMTRNHTGGEGWIVVGMAYAQPGKYQLDAAGIEKELKVFRFVRDELVKKHGLDVTRMYAAGYSKGGWMTDALLQAEPGFAGGAILMGGHVPTGLKPAPRIDPKKEVFIGVGRLDPNYLMSLKALLFYREKKLPTSFESWPGLGHRFPQNGSRGLREWFALQNDEKPDEAELQKEFTKLQTLDPVKAWRELIDFQARPYCNVKNSAWPDQISAALKKLEQNPTVTREAKVRMSHRRLLAGEVKMRTFDELRKINAGYLQLREEGAKTSWVDVIDLDHKRVMGVLKQTEAANPERPKPRVVTPDPPKEQRGFPRNPLIR
ncbi:MAG: hypothetical protein ACON38_15440 [Akkermansiaceae bacterium]